MTNIGVEQATTAGIPDLYVLSKPEARRVPSGDHASACYQVSMVSIGVEQATTVGIPDLYVLISRGKACAIGGPCQRMHWPV